jgi:hypothetical protein
LILGEFHFLSSLYILVISPYTLEQIGIGKDFLSRTTEAQQLRESMNKWDFIKLESFCTAKEMVFKLKDHAQSGRKYLPVKITDFEHQVSLSLVFCFSNFHHEIRCEVQCTVVYFP